MVTKKILITPGDPAGIGMECVLKALNTEKFKVALALVGPKELWEYVAIYEKIPIKNIEYFEVPLLEKYNDFVPKYAEIDAVCGKIAMECVRFAVHFCLDNPQCALMTAPINKSAIHKAGYQYTGHTDFISEISDVEKHAMMLSNQNLKIVLVTHHQALRTVSDSITTSAILEKIELADNHGKKINKNKCKLAVCALNPHAGENGKFGNEEQEIILPAIESAKAKGINVSGPFSSDTIFRRASNQEFDFVIAMYHDQGLIPIKLNGLGGINSTLGLPFFRTSPDHGTAFEIAGKHSADVSSTVAALKAAEEYINAR